MKLRQAGRMNICLARTAGLLLLLISSVDVAATISSGYSGMWYDSARSGEGLQLEILSPDLALVEWYTYDGQGNQRWIQGVGQIAGDTIQFPQIYVTQGGKFGPAFNPNDVKLQVVGSMSLMFGGCNIGTFEYSAFGQSQTLPIQRLTQTMGAGCAPINGVPGQPVMPYAGQSGSWYNPSRSGEGFDLQWLSNGAAIVTWYTYDTSGNQVWLLGVGAEQNGAIVFPQMAITHGPQFGAAYDTTALQQDDWGSLTLRLDCNGGTAHYASNKAAFGTGDLTLTRLTYLQQPACPYVQPKLSDLYSITWDEIPIAQGTPANPNIISAESIANDGTVAGRRGGHLVLWHPDTKIWESIPRDLAAVPVFISPDASKVIATDDGPADESQPVHTLLWQRSTGWQALPGDVIFDSVTLSVSRNFQFAAGYGHNKGETDQAWIRAVDGMQQVLPMPELNTVGNPLAISDDGNTVIGMALRFTTPSGWPTPVAVRWQTNGQSTILHNPAGDELAVASTCNADCSIIFGNHLYNYDPSQAHSGEAWYLKSDGAFNYLGALADEWITPGYGVTDVTADGAFAVGSYVTNPPTAAYPAATVNRAFVWTQTTGIVSVRSLVSELGIGDDDWDRITTIQLSPDGNNILLGGTHRLDIYPNGYSRAVVLHLTPKISAD